MSDRHVLVLPQLDLQAVHQQLAHVPLNPVHLLVGQRTVHVPVSNAVGLRAPPRARVRELIEELHALHEVPGDLSDDLVQVVRVEGRGRQPEAHVLVARRVLGVGHKLDGFTGTTELRQEALVSRPEEADVGNLRGDEESERGVMETYCI